MGAPKENINAEKWTVDSAEEFLNECIKLSSRKIEYSTGKGFEFHFIGEIASELNQYSGLPLYLGEKFKTLKPLYNRLKTKLESNCFFDSKRGIIKEASAIMNLKSNYGWTDRVAQNENHSGEITITRKLIK